jgi:3alpha(or 20beta)-hydroxysteroid dehydrogenase
VVERREDDVSDRLGGKHAVVTGGTMGIGEGIVRAFLAEGARVIFTARHIDRGPALAAELGPRATFRAFDHTDAEAWERLAEETESDPVQVLVNNAGGLHHRGRVHELSPAEFREEVEINLVGPFLGMRVLIPQMLRHGGGSIVNIASMSGERAQPDAAAYQASKAALRWLTKNAAMTYATQGIRVNTINPGVIVTPLQATMPSTREQWFYDRIPMQRRGLPAEVAAAAVFLAADESSYVTGIDLDVDGGYAM